MPGHRFHMAKSHLKLVAPTEVKRTVAPKRQKNAELRTREHLTPDEVETLIEAARGNRHGHRDATMILLTYRHGLRAAGLRSPLGPGRLQRRGATCPPGQERHAEHAPDPGRRASDAAPAPAGERSVALRVRQRARIAVHHGRLRPHDRARRDWRWPRAQGAPAHAAPRLRLRPRQQGPRHPGDPRLARTSVDHQHGGLHGAGAEQIQGLLAGLSARVPSRR
jgi:hypothetical protein